MPRLVKGGKWTYGWVVVGSEGKITIPPEAWRDFGFRPGGEAIFTPGSHTSGGFAISTPELMADASTRLEGNALRVLGQAKFNEREQVTLPVNVLNRPDASLKPGDRLLTVRGSCYGLGFVARGPIYEEALQHPELACFGGEPWGCKPCK